MPLQAAELSFSYAASRPVLRGVSLALEPGSMCALVGPNGAGKSTLLRLLLGVLTPHSGSVLLDGSPIAGMTHRQRARRIAYVPQRTSLAFAFSVRQCVHMGRYAAGGGSGDAQSVAAALERVGLADRADDPLGTLSAGQQQRVSLARALAQLDTGHATPGRYLLADEPVSAMDPRHALEAMLLLRSLADSGLGIAVVLHDLTLAARFCDRAAVLDRAGTLAAAGPAAQTLTPETLGRVFEVRFSRVGSPDDPAAAALVPSLPPGH